MRLTATSLVLLALTIMPFAAVETAAKDLPSPATPPGITLHNQLPPPPTSPLLVPVVTHAAYDFGALLYLVRRKPAAALPG